jgi:probable HAF family extracellular repeat protein
MTRVRASLAANPDSHDLRKGNRHELGSTHDRSPSSPPPGLTAVVVLATLTVGTTAVPAPLMAQAAPRPAAGADATAEPRSPSPGFLLDRGRYIKIAFPGALTTSANGINNRGEVVGEYRDANGRIHGYVWQRGRFQTVDAPGAAATTMFDINDRGQIVGTRLEPDGRTGRGFVLERGRFTVFAAPGAGLTAPTDVNNRGQILGVTASDFATPAFQGFLLAKGIKGPFTQVNFPGAPSTLVSGLNDRGQITGTYVNPNATPSPPPATASPIGRMA